MGFSVGIIGAASNGISVLCNMLGSASSNVGSVTLIDPRPPGWGPVFNPESRLLLCNTSAATQSLIADKPDDFLDYLASRGHPAQADTYAPRDLFGEYVRTRYQQCLDLAAARHIKINYNAGRAMSVHCRNDGSYEVYLDDDRPQRFDSVVIAIGFAVAKVADGFTPYRDYARLIGTPFPTKHLRQRLPHGGARVLVLGTGQSGIDTAIVLCHDGHRVTMASRSGTLPAVRNRFLPAPVPLPSLAAIPALDPNDPRLDQKLTHMFVTAVRTLAPVPLRQQLSFATDPVQRLREEVDLLAAGRCIWQDAILSLVEQLITWTSDLPLAVQSSLLAPRRSILRYISAMAAPNAERLLQYIDACQLDVATYNPSHVTIDQGRFEVDIQPHGPQRFDYAINSVGFTPPTLHIDGRSIHLNNPPGTATVLEHLGADLRIRLDPTAPPERIWLVGQTTHLRTPLAHFLPLAVSQAGQIATQLSTL